MDLQRIGCQEGRFFCVNWHLYPHRLRVILFETSCSLLHNLWLILFETNRWLTHRLRLIWSCLKQICWLLYRWRLIDPSQNRSLITYLIGGSVYDRWMLSTSAHGFHCCAGWISSCTKTMDSPLVNRLYVPIQRKITNRFVSPTRFPPKHEHAIR